MTRKGSRRYSGYIDTMTSQRLKVMRMLRRQTSAGRGGVRVTILFMVVMVYHFDCWLVVGSLHSKL
jgi:hypothetical protein